MYHILSFKITAFLIEGWGQRCCYEPFGVSSDGGETWDLFPAIGIPES